MNRIDGQKAHRWNLSWPGNFCLDCGYDDPVENSDNWVDCPECAKTDANCAVCGDHGVIFNPDFQVPPCPYERPAA